MTENDIIKIVCEACGIEVGALKAKTKVKSIVAAKHMVAHHIWSRTRLNIRQIAQFVGLSPQSLYEVIFDSKISVRRQTDAEFNELYGLIEKTIQKLMPPPPPSP